MPVWSMGVAAAIRYVRAQEREQKHTFMCLWETLCFVVVAVVVAVAVVAPPPSGERGG